jgi:hypothetical protein
VSGYTSGTDTWSQTAIQLITATLRVLGVIADEETPTASMLLNAMDALNAMVKGWSAAGIRLWCQEECILFPNVGQPQYQLGPAGTGYACLFNSLNQSALSVTAAAGDSSVTLSSVSGILAGDTFGVQLDAGVYFWTTVASAPTGYVVPLSASLPSQATSGALSFDYTTPLQRPLRVPEGRRYQFNGQIEIPMTVYSRMDYDYLPNKYNQGAFTAFYYDPQQGQGSYNSAVGLMNLWPAPADLSAALRFVAQRRIQDFTSLAQIPDLPTEWNAALKFNLAKEIALEYDVAAARLDRVEKFADTWFARCSMWDREPVSMLFGVAMEPGYRTG